jgi:hypothetical protein
LQILPVTPSLSTFSSLPRKLFFHRLDFSPLPASSSYSLLEATTDHHELAVDEHDLSSSAPRLLIAVIELVLHLDRLIIELPHDFVLHHAGDDAFRILMSQEHR